jgi:hypothetical protein
LMSEQHQVPGAAAVSPCRLQPSPAKLPQLHFASPGQQHKQQQHQDQEHASPPQQQPQQQAPHVLLSPVKRTRSGGLVVLPQQQQSSGDSGGNARQQHSLAQQQQQQLRIPHVPPTWMFDANNAGSNSCVSSPVQHADAAVTAATAAAVAAQTQSMITSLAAQQQQQPFMQVQPLQLQQDMRLFIASTADGQQFLIQAPAGTDPSKLLGDTGNAATQPTNGMLLPKSLAAQQLLQLQQQQAVWQAAAAAAEYAAPANSSPAAAAATADAQHVLLGGYGGNGSRLATLQAQGQNSGSGGSAGNSRLSSPSNSVRKQELFSSSSPPTKVSCRIGW